MVQISLLFLTTLSFLSLAFAVPSSDYAKYVNVFQGTANGGNMFPGVVAAPYAFVKLGPDLLDNNNDAYSGYLPQGNISGFSMMHESGTGGGPKYGVVSQLPYSGLIPNPLLNLSVPRMANDTGGLGWYRAKLSPGLTVNLAASAHAARFSYKFPADQAKNVVVDVSHVLFSYRGLGWSQNYDGGAFKVFKDGHYEGHGVYNGGWNLAPEWTIYFCGHFDTPPSKIRTFTGPLNSTTLSQYGTTNSTHGPYRVGAVYTFKDTKVVSRVGVSFISATKACRLVATEMPAGTSHSTLVSQARSNWNKNIFSKVQTSSSNQTLLTQLYSSLYAMHIIPSNRSGENPLWHSTEPSYDDIFTFWDLFRCTTALRHILWPAAHIEQLRSLVDIWKHEGWLPDARSSNFNGKTQGGSNADNILADAYVKGLCRSGGCGLNWTDAYGAMLKDAEVTPPNNHDPIAPDSSTAQGRGALPDWLVYSYITPSNFSRSVSRGVEYAANDFGLYQVAQGLNLSSDAELYLNRSRNWRNYYNDNANASLAFGDNPTQNTTFSGFIVPRNANGTFVPQDPLTCGDCYWEDDYYEATPWEYTFAAGHHDMAALIYLSGGAANFTSKLEAMFQFNLSTSNSEFNYTIVNPGNEPSFTAPYLFNFAGRQDLSVKYSRQIAKLYYGAGTGGIPGNSDAGAMQSWLLWNMIGLYPLTGQTTFLIASPWFESMKMTLGNGKTLAISSTGGDGTGDSSYYVQSLKVNGQSWTKSWLVFDDVFKDGGSMEYVLGPEPQNWATGDLPPSPASSDIPS